MNFLRRLFVSMAEAEREQMQIRDDHAIMERIREAFRRQGLDPNAVRHAYVDSFADRIARDWSQAPERCALRAMADLIVEGPSPETAEGKRGTPVLRIVH